MKNALVALGLLLTLATSSPEVRAIDPARSSAQFSVQHIWVENVKGSVPIIGGSVTLAADATTPTSVTAVLDATRISTDDPDRDRSLESPDFFDAQKFPHWTFTSTRVVPKAPTAFELDGTLTIHGITQPEKLMVEATGTGAHATYRATAEIDRHAFGMATTRLDPTIGKTAHVTLDIALK